MSWVREITHCDPQPVDRELLYERMCRGLLFDCFRFEKLADGTATFDIEFDANSYWWKAKLTLSAKEMSRQEPFIYPEKLVCQFETRIRYELFGKVRVVRKEGACK